MCFYCCNFENVAAQATQDAGPCAHDVPRARFEEFTEYDLWPSPQPMDDDQTPASLELQPAAQAPDDTQPAAATPPDDTQPAAAAPDDTQLHQNDVATPDDGCQPDSPEDAPQGSQKTAHKRIFLRDLTEEEKAVEVERRKERARQNSKAWHEKWVSKGVLKGAADRSANGEGDTPEEPAHEVAPKEPLNDDGPGDENQPADDGPGDENQPADDGPGDENQPADDGPGDEHQPADDGPRGENQPLDDGPGHVTAFVPDKTLLDTAISGDLRKTRMMYMNAWTEWKQKEIFVTTARKELMDQANKEWLKSELRAQCQAARSNKVY